MQGSKKMYIYIVISFILASAFCLSSFATESLSLDDSQFSLIWNAQNWNYFQQGVFDPNTSTGNSYFKPGTYRQFYMFDTNNGPASYNGLSVFGREVTFSHINTFTFRVNVPLSLVAIDGFSTDFYYGLWNIHFADASIDLNDYISSITIGAGDADGNAIDIQTIEFDRDYYFNLSPSLSNSSSYSGYRNFKRISAYFDTSSVALVYFRFVLKNPLPTPDDFHFFIGMSSQTEISAEDGQQQAIIGGLNGIQGTIDNLMNDLQENDGKILDSLGNVEYFLEGDAVTAAEAEKMVEDSVSKSEELDQLGDALANVEKPDINNITQQFSPNIILGKSDNAALQLALSQVYGWDKLITILGVFVGIFTISFIIFGKKK